MPSDLTPNGVDELPSLAGWQRRLRLGVWKSVQVALIFWAVTAICETTSPEGWQGRSGRWIEPGSGYRAALIFTQLTVLGSGLVAALKPWCRTTAGSVIVGIMLAMASWAMLHLDIRRGFSGASDVIIILVLGLVAAYWLRQFGRLGPDWRWPGEDV